MVLIKCSNCGEDYSDLLSVCKHCNNRKELKWKKDVIEDAPQSFGEERKQQTNIMSEITVRKILEGTKYEKYISDFHLKGISEIEDIRDLKKNGNLIQILNEIIGHKEDILGLKDLLQASLNKAGLKLMLIVFGPILLLIIITMIILANA